MLAFACDNLATSRQPFWAALVERRLQLLRQRLLAIKALAIGCPLKIWPRSPTMVFVHWLQGARELLVTRERWP